MEKDRPEDEDRRFLDAAIALAEANVEQGGRPFGAVLAKDGEVVATGVNEMHLTPDPTAHAELLAVRQAAARLGTTDLSGTTIYASGQPCPMCMGAMRMAGVARVLYAYSNDDGAPFGLSTAEISADLARPVDRQTTDIRHVRHRRAGQPDLYERWSNRR